MTLPLRQPSAKGSLRLPPLIAFEGPPTAGKTMLAKKFSAYFHIHCFLEPTPRLLSWFYDNPKERGLLTQLLYLQKRIRHAQQLRTLLHQGSRICMDYAFWKDIVYAQHFLHQAQFRLYRGLYHSLDELWLQPSVLVFLDCSAPVAMRRLRARNRSGEDRLTEKDIDDLRNLTLRKVRAQECDTVLVDTDHLPIESKSRAREELFQTVIRALQIKQ